MPKHFPTLAACDFGSSKISILISEMTPEGLEAIGFGEAESHGIRKGVIVNIDATVEALNQAIREAQAQSESAIDFLIAGVSGSHLQGISSKGMVPIRDSEVKRSDIERVIEAGSAVSIPLDREIIQVIPQEFVIDGQDGIHEPLGMYGKRLEVNLQLLTGSITALENIRRCLQRSGLKAHHFISSALASGRATSTAQEREAGVCIVDIGAASTDLAVFQDGALSWIRSIPMGGMHLTHDLAVGLKTALNEAERIKREYGCAFETSDFDTFESKSLQGNESRSFDRKFLGTILQPRIEEILGLVRVELARYGVDESLPSGVILTGGGSHLKGLLTIAEKVFQLPVRLGYPQTLGLGALSDRVASASHSAIVGLLQLGFEETEELQYYASLYEKKGFKKMQTRLSRWFKDFF